MTRAFHTETKTQIEKFMKRCGNLRSVELEDSWRVITSDGARKEDKAFIWQLGFHIFVGSRVESDQLERYYKWN